MARLVSMILIHIAANVCAQDRDRDHHRLQSCGGHLKGPVGIIQTPNFPNPFPVPIKCKWIIEHDIVNGTISIYFTQQYTTSGLTFTEYSYYDETYKLEEKRVLTVTEENITKVKRLQVQSPVLVVELNLNRLEGTQLRALGLLSVFGFNITYAVRSPVEVSTPTPCSAIQCRLLGHCYARHDFQEFFCSCFESYSGEDCGIGPLCTRTPKMCRNGGTCRQMGPATISCICAPGYTGNLCESQIAQHECGAEECSEGCAKEYGCDCSPKDKDFTLARFDTRLQVVDQPNINISQEIIKQLTSYLRTSNITLDDEIEILNMSSVGATGARMVYIRVWSAKNAADALRAALAKLAASRSRPHTLRLLPDTLYFDIQPALSLQALALNQRPEIWEGSEFILTCMAHGSPDIVFTWYKDGVKINFNATTREIWTRIVAEDTLGRRMSVLAVSGAQQIDGGTWSCAADDSGRRRCRALTLTVLTPPSIRLIPSTLTVYKGDNVTITCLTGAGRAHGVLGFSWARERSLLRMQPDRHVWEDLYPSGSVLKLYNVQKSSEYRCQVSSSAGTNSVSVWVWALDDNDDACESESMVGTLWARTAPGAYASITCPPGYSGEITRFCEPKTGQHGVKWMPLDYSGCIADPLKDIYEKFTLISYGFSWDNVSEVTRQYSSVLRSLSIPEGAGVTPLRHAAHMLQYLLSAAVQHADKAHSVTHLLNIYDYLLTQPDAFVDEQKIYELQNAIPKVASITRKLELHLHSFSVRSESSMHMELDHSLGQHSSAEWRVESTRVDLAFIAKNLTIVTVFYQDLGARLPSLRTLTKHSGVSEVQYALCSQQVQVYISGTSLDRTLQLSVTLLLKHSLNYSADASKLACGFRSAAVPGVWRVSGCDIRISQGLHAICHCRGAGTFALFTQISSTSTDSKEDLHGILVICLNVSGAMCVCVSIIQLLSIMPATARRRDTMYAILAAGTATGNAAAMFALSNCHDTEVSLSRLYVWVVAVSWCIASAALCAQPLLLHAELAGTAQRSHSVGLLAGVCVLCCLSARMWGDAPLKVGSAANSIFAAGIIILTVLTLALALCARRMLEHVTRKLPLDRRTYIRNRNRIVNNTLVLLLTSMSTIVAGVTYVQPGDKLIMHILALSVAAFANGAAMLVCYVIRDEECLRAVRSKLPLHDSTVWQDSPAGDTSISLYIKQGGEVESRGGVVMLESSPVSSTARYWHATPLERRRSNPDSRADIVKCVEYKSSAYGGARYDTHPRSVCDLIPTGVVRSDHAGEEYLATVCLEVNPYHKPVAVMSSLEPYTEKQFDIAKETCAICVQSNPDVSKITSAPVKSCLKKGSQKFTSSTSLPSIETIKEEFDKTHIEQINQEWNKTYDNPQTSKVLNKISTDLDFLLNRTQQTNTPHQEEEAPT
ncbi:unnamed protein product [Arctia plantaginis]|uniref:Uncharacterized protein n=1 Tax=Arctia plantaginis TaxID=874455 RepID=A0A8S1AM89_ARCPL|nr:unnamed protein product [Arctia plantaginis]